MNRAKSSSTQPLPPPLPKSLFPGSNLLPLYTLAFHIPVIQVFCPEVKTDYEKYLP